MGDPPGGYTALDHQQEDRTECGVKILALDSFRKEAGSATSSREEAALTADPRCVKQ